MEIEEINTENPIEFWKQINSLGPRKNNKIPVEVYAPDSSEKLYDTESVLNTWRSDFETLFNIPENEHVNFDSDFYDDIMSQVSNIKRAELTNFDDSAEYNKPFDISEIDNICERLKLNKSVGPDMIPNEVLRHPNLRELLLNLLNMCFINNSIPSVWRKAIIAPIPKSSAKDPCVPLNYRGISLLSCV